MYGIHINPHTQNYIAKTFNNGIVPQIEETSTVYLVTDDDHPNQIVLTEEFYRELSSGTLYMRITDHLKNR